MQHLPEDAKATIFIQISTQNMVLTSTAKDVEKLFFVEDHQGQLITAVPQLHPTFIEQDTNRSAESLSLADATFGF